MTSTVPALTLPQLTSMGKEALEYTATNGQFFFPKLVVGYDDGRSEPIQMAQYEGEFDALVECLDFMASQGPIKWLALTSDSYELTGSLTEHDPLVRSVLAGEQRLAELFEDDHPSVTEALQIVLVHDETTAHVSLPYTRRGTKIVWTNPANLSQAQSFSRVEDAIRAAISASMQPQ